MSERPKESLMPCGECLKKLALLEKYLDVDATGNLPIRFCEHQMTVAVINANGFLCLHEAYEENQAFKAAMQINTLTLQAACKVVYEAMLTLPDDVKEILLPAMQKLMEAKPEP